MDPVNYHNVLEIQSIKSLLVEKPLLLEALNQLVDLVNKNKLTKENLVDNDNDTSEEDSDSDYDIIVNSDSD